MALYPTHIPLHPLQKGALAAVAAAGALLRPQRADLVATVAETTGTWHLERLRARMQADPEGRQVLAERPLVTDESVAACWDMPPHTFGAAYARFMGARGFHADDRPPVRFVDDAELAYVLRRMREVHDFWHVLFDCHTNVFGELALKGLEFVQTGVPMTGLAVVGAQWRLKPEDRALLQSQYLPWALRAGNRCKDLMTVHYEKHFEDDLDELRRKLRIIPAPSPPPHLGIRLKSRPHGA
mmetsp:Transcript_8693/g.15023  ORF Transcript_8693/g.15023 Transcript_8693/m.15023 type:complete len:240 (+) Transcript_8693:75-794(+)|eukprot:CAMPEP_0119105444 /NCGR_PEP_ID=MMETSP1180-20130426/3401_1 /TAXON_ID=3052 ORGANISM="Chlamydomonas cf sp, Strain CCMP681" /NCGR_SAMPLE_ID=MMETSP1180 /ASSEMBLY_ACC=CAM_ASM_000741 /LENGTH=239 /DNA_ID=CAMNT_0007090487 /DNA_START=67 /DNA_END=786 /DNA_ORIENTATION=-